MLLFFLFSKTTKKKQKNLLLHENFFEMRKRKNSFRILGMNSFVLSFGLNLGNFFGEKKFGDE